MLTHCPGVFAWRPCGSVQNSMSIEKLMAIARNWGESVDGVQGDDGNTIALLGSVCLATLQVGAKLHVHREADGDR